MCAAMIVCRRWMYSFMVHSPDISRSSATGFHSTLVYSAIWNQSIIGVLVYQWSSETVSHYSLHLIRIALFRRKIHFWWIHCYSFLPASRLLSVIFDIFPLFAVFTANKNWENIAMQCQICKIYVCTPYIGIPVIMSYFFYVYFYTMMPTSIWGKINPLNYNTFIYYFLLSSQCGD